ncbi:MAG: divergent polysaccharide deacetylase family protein [Rickettsiales bacterium]|nr:divergent polysaccharide deacetylase family protein [Rickettsiales bacterium]
MKQHLEKLREALKKGIGRAELPSGKNFWLLINGLLALLLAFLTYSFFTFFTDTANTAISSGKQIRFHVPSNALQARSVAMMEVAEEEIDKGPIENPEIPRIAVIVANVGMDWSVTEQTMMLPSSFALSFSPYISNRELWMQNISQMPHDVLVDLPLEPVRFPQSDPGELALLTQLENTENMERFERILGRAGEEAVGMLAPPNEKYTAQLSGMLPLIDILKKRDMFLVYEPRASNEIMYEEAVKKRLKIVKGVYVMANAFSPGDLVASLAQVEWQARESGRAVLVLPPYPGLFPEVLEWLKGVPEKKFELVSLQALYIEGAGEATYNTNTPANTSKVASSEMGE